MPRFYTGQTFYYVDFGRPKWPGRYVKIRSLGRKRAELSNGVVFNVKAVNWRAVDGRRHKLAARLYDSESHYRTEALTRRILDAINRRIELNKDYKLPSLDSARAAAICLGADISHLEMSFENLKAVNGKEKVHA